MNLSNIDTVEQYIDYAVVKKEPTTTSTQKSFSGEITFNWAIPSNKILFGKSMRLNSEIIVSRNNPEFPIFHGASNYSVENITAVANSLIGYISDLENCFNKCIVQLNEKILYSIDNFNYGERVRESNRRI